MYQHRKSLIEIWSGHFSWVRDWLRSTHLHGYKHLAVPNRILLDRCLWFAVLMSFVSVTIYATSSSLISFYEAPTTISELPIKRPVTEMPFPAVTVCHPSRFTRSRISNLTDFIFKHQNATSELIGNTWSDVFRVVKALIYLVDLSLPQDLTDITTLHRMLTEYYNGSYPIEEMIRSLHPTCNDIITRCYWQDIPYNCSAFRARKTYMGSCCIFNYKRPLISEFRIAESMNLKLNYSKPIHVSNHRSARRKGVSFVVDYSLEDMEIAIGYTMEYKILIGSSYDFPDIWNGGIREVIVEKGTETTIYLSPKQIRASPDLRTISKSLRGCVFPDEIELVFKGYYTLGECLYVCRLQDVIRMCGCMPPAMTPVFNASYCDLGDLPCLARWKEKWSNYDSVSSSTTTASDLCPNCFPTCNYVRYEVASAFNKLRNSTEGMPNWGINATEIATHSIVHVVFGERDFSEYEQNMISTWYELLSNFGGTLSFVIGGSVISLIEFLYYCTGRFGTALYRRVQRHFSRASAHAAAADNDDPIPFVKQKLAFVN